MANICLKDLNKLADDGVMTSEEAKNLFKKLKKIASERSEDTAQSKIESLQSERDNILDEVERDLNKQKFNALNNILIRKQIRGFIKNFKNPTRGYQAFLDGVQSNIAKSRDSVGLAQRTMSERLHSVVLDGLIKDNNLASFHNKAMESDIVKELWEKGSTKNKTAGMIANVIKKAYEVGRKRLRSVGVDIGELPEYIGRQSHNPEKLGWADDKLVARTRLLNKLTLEHGWKKANEIIKEMAFQRWKNFVLPRLDHKRTFADAADREKALRGAWTALRTSEHLKAPEEIQAFDGKFSFKSQSGLGARVGAARKIHFKDGQSAYEYMKEYGDGNLVANVHFTLRSMGDRYGLISKMGLNPEAMHKTIMTELRETQRDVPGSKRKIFFADSIFKELTGEARIPVSNMFAKISAGLRAWVSMSKLGTVIFSSVPDLALNASMLKDHGIGYLDGYSKVLGGLLDGKSDSEKMRLGALLGVWSQSSFGHMISYVSTADTPAGFMTKSMQVYFKLTGMEWYDRTQRTTMGTVLSRNLALNKDKVFDNLDEGEKKVLNRYGIKHKEWDLIRSAPLKPHGNTNFIMPDSADAFTKENVANFLGKDVSKLTDVQFDNVKEDMRERLFGYFIDQTDNGNLRPTASDRAMIHQGLRPGTLWGEVARFVGQFKMFPISFSRRVLGRHLLGNSDEGIVDAIKNRNVDIRGIAHIIAGSTALGYIGMSAKDMLKGLQPRDPKDPKTMVAAFLQGGGLGIYGDFLFGEYNRFGGSFLDTAAGPGLGTISNVAKLWSDMRDGDDPGAATLRLLENNTPFLNLWFVRTAMNYMVLYDLQERVSPGSLNRMVTNVQNNRNQSFIFSPLTQRQRPFTK